MFTNQSSFVSCSPIRASPCLSAAHQLVVAAPVAVHNALPVTVRLEVMGQRSDFITPAALLESADVSSLARQEWCWLRPEGLAGIRIHIAGYRPVQLDLDAVHARCGPLVAERMPLQ